MKHRVEITGMHCPTCAETLEQYLRSEPGVDRATVEYDTNRGTITTTAGTDVQELLDSIRRMGYEAEPVE